MLNFTSRTTYYLSSTPTDMRNGRESLVGIIREKCSMILIVMMKSQGIMYTNNLLEVGKYSNMEDELCGYQERMIGQESKNPPKIW